MDGRGMPELAAVWAATAGGRARCDGKLFRKRGRRWAVARGVVELDPQCRTTTTKVLFKSWSGWCERNGEPIGTTTTFGEALNKRGFDKWKSKHERGYGGLRLAEIDTDKSGALV